MSKLGRWYKCLECGWGEGRTLRDVVTHGQRTHPQIPAARIRRAARASHAAYVLMGDEVDLLRDEDFFFVWAACHQRHEREMAELEAELDEAGVPPIPAGPGDERCTRSQHWTPTPWRGTVRIEADVEPWPDGVHEVRAIALDREGNELARESVDFEGFGIIRAGRMLDCLYRPLAFGDFLEPGWKSLNDFLS